MNKLPKFKNIVYNQQIRARKQLSIAIKMLPKQPDINRINSLSGKKFKLTSAGEQGKWTDFYMLENTGGKNFIMKYSSQGETDTKLEAWMLQKLANAGMPIPEIVYYDNRHLIMEYIEGSTHLSAKEQVHAAQLMAELHSYTNEYYGLDRSTVIGALAQPNNKEKNWAIFFGEHRLIYSADKAVAENQLDKSMYKRICKLAENIEDYLTGEETPSLVHGDMWGGNLIANDGKVKALIDPAIYYADAETELAFAALFGHFDQNFFDAYNEIRPIKPGFFEIRRYLYNVYPLLVHVRLFGSSYLSRLDNHLKTLGI